MKSRSLRPAGWVGDCSCVHPGLPSAPKLRNLPPSLMPSPPPFLFRYRWAFIALWAAAIAFGLYLFIFHRAGTQQDLRLAMSASIYTAGLVYLILTIIRGLIMVPAAPLVLVGVAFLPPWPLFFFTLVGTVISSVIIYLFPEYLQLEKLFGSRATKLIDRLRRILAQRDGLLVIAVWSFIPFTPTNLIVYTCGLLQISLRKTILGVALGSAANSALYIFLGDYLLRFFGLK